MQRGLIAAVQVLGLSVWFSVSAVVPTLRAEWEVSTTQAVWLTGTVQLGFVVGALGSALLNLPDRVRGARLMAGGAAAAAACTFAVAIVSNGMASALPLRFLTGVFLAGVYPVGIKLTASWSTTRDRGTAMGLLIGALTLGSTLPYLVTGLSPGAGADLPWRQVLAVTAVVGWIGAAVALLGVRTGPHVAAGPTRLNPRYMLQMWGERGPRLVNLGYLGHMWELYALWT